MIGVVIVSIIVLVILLLFFVIMLLLTKRQDVTLTTLDSNGRIKNEKGSIEQQYENGYQNLDKKTRKKLEKERRKYGANFDASGAWNNAKSAAQGYASSASGYAKDAMNGVQGKMAGVQKINPAGVSTEKELREGIKREDIFKFMEFDRILDNMIVQKNGSRFTMAIKCKGINYDLMSEVEQLAVEEGFITFLNTLKYPIQLYVQAQNVDLKKVTEIYKSNVKSVEEQYNDINLEYSRMASAFDADEIQLAKLSKERDSITNVYEYAKDMVKYVQRMDKNKKMLKRSFYILTSYTTSEVVSADKFNKDELIDMCQTELSTRCQAIISALQSCSVSGQVLDSNELAQLLYNAYNRDDAGIMNVKENIESGFYRLYSVSEDAFMKKEQALEEYLNDSARVKALEAIKYAILNNDYKTPAMEALEQEEEISRRATNMVNNEDYDKDFKDRVNGKILSDYRETKRALLEEDAAEKEVVKEQAREDMAELEELKRKMAESEIGQKIEKREELERQAQEELDAASENSQEMNMIPESTDENNDETIDDLYSDGDEDDELI